MLVRQSYDLPVPLGARAYVEDLFDRPLADEHMGGMVLLDYHRHTAPLEIERNLVDFGVARRDLQLRLDFRTLENRHIQEVLEARLVIAVEVGVLEDSL